MMMAWLAIDPGLDAALKCAMQSVRDSLGLGVSLSELVGWFYSDEAVPNSDDWDECVLRARWDTTTWLGVFRAWDECGRPEYDPSYWGGDDCDPDVRRAAQGNARLDAVGEMVFNRYPEAIEWAARELGWEVHTAASLGGVLPDDAVILDTDPWHWVSDSEWVTVLVPPTRAA